MCEISKPAWEGVPQDKLLYSFCWFLSCPILGTGIMFEETSIRYTAFVCLIFLVVSLRFQSSTHKKYLTDRASLNHRFRRNLAFTLDSDTFFSVLEITGFTQAQLQLVRAE